MSDKVIYKLCKDCKEELPIKMFYKSGRCGNTVTYRPECSNCSRDRKTLRGLYYNTVYNMAEGIIKRTVYKSKYSNPKNRCYALNNIICTLGNTPKEVFNTLDRYFKPDIQNYLNLGIKPSVDRIDSSKNYSIDNIRIIPLSVNVYRGVLNARCINSKNLEALDVLGNTIKFESVTEAAKFFKCKRDTIYNNMDGKISRKGYTFKYIR